MSAINDLIEQIDNPELRSRIQREVDRISKQKKFGLVFEEHLPENVNLYDVPVRRGKRVSYRNAQDGDKSKVWTVLKIDNDTAICISGEDEEPVSIPVKDLVVVAEFGEPIYPYLKPIDTICNAPDDELWHTLIEADNYHALQLLEYLYAGRVDCIYIDPPYNTGARDWKYNNDYVDSSDAYRHSKWLSFMQRRLALARNLLNPKNSALIVTIDEKEYLHLGCLLEQMFPEANIQMVSDAINRKGSMRQNGFQKTDEYIFFVNIGESCPEKLPLSKEWTMSEDETIKGRFKWQPFIRGNFKRSQRPNLFYPIFVDSTGSRIVRVGKPLAKDEDRHNVLVADNEKVLFPITTTGEESVWHLSYDTFLDILGKGYVKLGKGTKNRDVTISYLSSGTQKMIENGVFDVIDRDVDGSISFDTNDYVPEFVTGTQWRIKSHDATAHGTKLLSNIIGKRFSYPKSLYAVHDTLRFLVANKPNALILDFFAGSGTTLHAVILLNAEDGGHRRCIMVTNNEVSEEEAKSLQRNNHLPGSPEWEQFGIARYITWPRTVCSIEGHDINGSPLKGEYFDSDIKMSAGFKSNAAFFKLGFLDKNEVAIGRQFKNLLPVLWMKAGAKGPCPGLQDERIPPYMILPVNHMAILTKDTAYADFKADLNNVEGIDTVYLVTDSDSDYRAMIRDLGIETSYQIYRDYLDNFRINVKR